MGYRTLTVDERNRIETRTSTDGYQPKFIVNNGKEFVKVQSQIGGTLRDDWRVEDIASRICEQLKVKAVRQTPCHVKILTRKGIVRERMGVVSPNFEFYGYSFISFQRILEIKGCETAITGFERLSATDKLSVLVDTMSRVTNIPRDQVLKYFFDMVTVDLLVLNQDRHFRNFGIFISNSGRLMIPLLFDFGMGLFENDTMFDHLKSLEGCLRYSYIAPYGEDPFELIKELKRINAYQYYLRNIGIGGLRVAKELFIHPAAYEYYFRMRQEMQNV